RLAAIAQQLQQTAQMREELDVQKRELQEAVEAGTIAILALSVQETKNVPTSDLRVWVEPAEACRGQASFDTVRGGVVASMPFVNNRLLAVVLARLCCSTVSSCVLTRVFHRDVGVMQSVKQEVVFQLVSNEGKIFLAHVEDGVVGQKLELGIE